MEGNLIRKDSINCGPTWHFPSNEFSSPQFTLCFVQVASLGIEHATIPLEQATSVECSTTEPQLLDRIKLDVLEIFKSHFQSQFFQDLAPKPTFLCGMVFLRP